MSCDTWPLAEAGPTSAASMGMDEGVCIARQAGERPSCASAACWPGARAVKKASGSSDVSCHVCAVCVHHHHDYQLSSSTTQIVPLSALVSATSGDTHEHARAHIAMAHCKRQAVTIAPYQPSTISSNVHYSRHKLHLSEFNTAQPTAHTKHGRSRAHNTQGLCSGGGGGDKEPGAGDGARW